MLISINHLWRTRNDIKHSAIPRTEEQILKMIIWGVRTRIMGRGRFKGSRENVLLCQNWNIPLDVLI
jgi:hypothetical protein